MKKQSTASEAEPTVDAARPKRADAQRKLAALLQAAMEVFATSGVDAPVREIAEKAGVGLGTVYRHFPQRSDLIVAVMQSQIDACSAAAPEFAKQYEPVEALSHWLLRYAEFIATKRGLCKALYSGEPAYAALPEYFNRHLRPALNLLLDRAAEAKAIRPGTEADDLLVGVGNLCSAGYGRDSEHAQRMVKLLMDGLRYGVNNK